METSLFYEEKVLGIRWSSINNGARVSKANYTLMSRLNKRYLKLLLSKPLMKFRMNNYTQK